MQRSAKNYSHALSTSFNWGSSPKSRSFFTFAQRFRFHYECDPRSCFPTAMLRTHLRLLFSHRLQTLPSLVLLLILILVLPPKPKEPALSLFALFAPRLAALTLHPLHGRASTVRRPRYQIWGLLRSTPWLVRLVILLLLVLVGMRTARMHLVRSRLRLRMRLRLRHRIRAAKGSPLEPVGTESGVSTLMSLRPPVGY